MMAALDHQESKETPELRGQQDSKVPQVQEVTLVRLERLGQRVLRVTRVAKDLKGRQDVLVRLGHKEIPGLRDHKERLVNRDHLVTLDLKVHRGQLVHEVRGYASLFL